jgi:hypothetical protein
MEKFIAIEKVSSPKVIDLVHAIKINLQQSVYRKALVLNVLQFTNS